MKKKIMRFLILFSLSYLCLNTPVPLQIFGYCQTISINSANISGAKNNASADILIEHNRVTDLIVELGVGNPNNPYWSVNIWNKTDAQIINLIVNISEAITFLPPSENFRWFLKVFDGNVGNQGQISKFIITYNGQNYISNCIPVPIHDLQTSLSYIPGTLLEVAISRRISIRDFPSIENYTHPKIPWETLSRILWAGYGVSSYERTVPNICGSYPMNIYICNETAVYRYNPEKLSLHLWKKGDYRFSHSLRDYPGPGTTRAPVELFITLDKNKFDDINLGAMEAGCIIQNIYLEANSLGLGTVCVGGVNRESVTNVLGLPENEYLLYNMPLGYPKSLSSYNFTYVDPPKLSNLPRINQSSMLLDNAFLNVISSHGWTETPLTPQEISQILWSAYGRSYLKNLRIGKSQYQHRTVASAHGRYPLKIWMVNSTGIYFYNPWTHSTILYLEGDKRSEIAQAAEANWMDSAPMMLAVVWNSSKLERQDWAYTEIGFIIQNTHLESVAWGLNVDWSKNIDIDSLKLLLGIRGESDLHPVCVIAVGHPLPKAVDDIPPQIGDTFQQPSEEIITVGQEVKISANIIDIESGVKNATLYYTINNGTTWNHISMNFNTTSSLYEAIITGQDEEIWVKYYIIAYDNAGNRAEQKIFRRYLVSAMTQFSVNNLTISPVETKSGEKVTVSVTVTNTGEIVGSYTTKLEINGAIEDTKEVTLHAGESTTVNFEVTKYTEGIYNIEIGDKKGILEVKSKTALSDLIYISIFVVIILIVAIIWLIRARLS